MMALINTPQYEEVMEDLNNICFSVIEPKSIARNVWSMLEEYASGGSTEEFLYRELHLMIKLNESPESE
jgi:hypothetical protein